MDTQVLSPSVTQRLRAFYSLTKPRVVSLIVFTAVIGMFLATPGVVPLQILLAGIFGIWLVAGAAAVFNCLVEKSIDAKMRRTSWRATASGELSDWQTLLFAAVLCAIGTDIRNRCARTSRKSTARSPASRIATIQPSLRST